MENAFAAVKNAVHSTYKKAAESMIDASKFETKFIEEGVLTPEEFVASGDLLVYKCPTWSWAAGNPEKAVPHLPKDKQFLVTRNVPCKARYHDLVNKESETVDDDFQLVSAPEGEEIIQDVNVSQNQPTKEESDDDEDIPDMDDFNVENNLVENDAAAAKDTEDNVEKTRTYDISITYDTYYRTPKIWLFGYSENQQPLSGEEIFMDISEDHAKKTVTIEPHPNTGIPFAFIHPCRHASVMKKFIQRMLDNGKELRVDQYLLLFLKFMSAVIPTIAYDNTFEIGL
eukprot:TRINITY_DN1524_c1_g1_i1.p1 TRINITY_DN1524_c1_g1~~TRINITY_DN1524_c1_g1_i1.p1  ORF type:complete len:285 (+),score=73.29 TRINITY_DN1524_c1_g1_i1:14-868(+)